mgnify:CR=1 FL=1
MRIRETLPGAYCQSDEQQNRFPSIEDRQQFYSLFQRPSRQAVPDEEEETVAQRHKRLQACFLTLLQGSEAQYQDCRIQVRRTGEGKLRWRLLTGPLQGCTLYICWRAEEMTIDFSAAASLADRLLALQERLQRQLNEKFQSRLITIKVTRESGYV